MGHTRTPTFVQLKLTDAEKFAVTNTRRMDQETSIAAAKKISTRVAHDRQRVLAVHAANPEGLSDFELETLCGIKQTSCGKRRLDLQREGYIEKTALKRPSPSGSDARVWKITAAGLARAAEQGAGRNETVTAPARAPVIGGRIYAGEYILG